MLIPRFSMRMLLLGTTVCSLVSYVVMLAVRGQAWAIALSLVIGGLVLTFCLHVLGFAVAHLSATMRRLILPKAESRSPFAAASLPPQKVVPEDPE